MDTNFFRRSRQQKETNIFSEDIGSALPQTRESSESTPAVGEAIRKSIEAKSQIIEELAKEIDHIQSEQTDTEVVMQLRNSVVTQYIAKIKSLRKEVEAEAQQEAELIAKETNDEVNGELVEIVGSTKLLVEYLSKKGDVAKIGFLRQELLAVIEPYLSREEGTEERSNEPLSAGKSPLSALSKEEILAEDSLFLRAIAIADEDVDPNATLEEIAEYLARYGVNRGNLLEMREDEAIKGFMRSMNDLREERATNI